MTSNATMTGLVTVPGTDVGIRAEVMFVPQTVGYRLVLSDRTTIGPAKGETDVTGTIQSPGIKVPIVGGVLWNMVVSPYNTEVAPFSLGPFSVTASADIKDLAAITPTAVTAAVYADILAAIALGATNDTATASYVNTTSATRTALDARYGLKPTNAARSVGQGELVVNVKDYGAVGDGTTDDTAAINNAKTAVGSAGRVYFPAGVYAVATSLTVASGIILDGGFGAATLKKTGSSTAHFVTIAVSAAGTTLRGLKFDANSLASSTVINFGGAATDITIEGCTIVNAAAAIGVRVRDGGVRVVVQWCLLDGVATGFQTDGACSFVTYAHNRVKNWSQRGFYTTGTASLAPSDLTLFDNRITDMAIGGSVRQPITFEGDDTNLMERVKVNHNTVIGPANAWTAPAATAWAASTAYVVGNVRNNGADNYRVTTSGTSAASGGPTGTGTAITDGTVVWTWDATGRGTADQISLHRCADYEVIGNISMYGGDGGIAVGGGCRRGVVNDNVCSFNDVTGIFLGSASLAASGMTLAGNTLVNNGQNRNADRSDASRTGIYANLTSDTIIGINQFGDDQATKTQKYGVSFINSTNITVGTNVDTGNALGMYNPISGNVNITGVTKPVTLIGTGANETANAVGPTTVWTPTAYPAGTFAVGSVFEFDLAGTIDCMATSGNFTGRVSIGATFLGTFTVAASQTGAATNLNWNVRIRITIDAIGSGGSVSATGTNTNLAAGGTTWTVNTIGVYGTAINLATSFAPIVQLGMGTANAANKNRINRAVLRQVA